MSVNDPEVIAELSQVYSQYETALVTNDIPTMQRLFWASPHVVRFGASENLHGIDEIEAFRLARPTANLARKITRLDITTFGKNFGCINLEFERKKDGVVISGRQSQTWVRMLEGWRIVAAHVSLLS
jgi:hypothetical protein